ncbi:hypothetical protein HanXRQr2_Chr04g0176791 [Helianthus annuus]|uniref:Uncharacterized protein n=1 Tax=Helianthus annuus TaxID=4232 RepID=A0A9K3JA58_HELAN|nr:hypothetical protein HanXRQr2_Chr04g0176791 [Helianthus annuus]KAJ0932168.1 hypothetical protein HanPSC8_Chr04g0170541 [Helianthus annuus]
MKTGRPPLVVAAFGDCNSDGRRHRRRWSFPVPINQRHHGPLSPISSSDRTRIRRGGRRAAMGLVLLFQFLIWVCFGSCSVQVLVRVTSLRRRHRFG